MPGEREEFLILGRVRGIAQTCRALVSNVDNLNATFAKQPNKGREETRDVSFRFGLVNVLSEHNWKVHEESFINCVLLNRTSGHNDV
jgi:hypothetical protein